VYVLPELFRRYLYTINLVVSMKKEKPKSPLFTATLMRGKNLLHIINETISMSGLLRNLIHTYKYREIIILMHPIILDKDIR
jgi:hypothetical protein